jgi:predicted ferric reductase
VNPHVWWYLARAGGLVSYALLAVSTIWGLAVSTRLLGRWPAPGWTLDLHRFLGGLAVVFTGIHLLGLVLDSYVRFEIVDLLVPFASSWRPAAVAWGVIGLYLLLAVELTSLARRRLPYRLWRRVHLGAFALLVVATAHLVTAGSDRASLPVVMMLAVTGTATTFLALFRTLLPSRPGRAASSRPGRPTPARPGHAAPARPGRAAPAPPGRTAPARAGSRRQG